MAVNVRKAGNANVVDLQGPLTIGEPVEAFSAQLKELLDAGARNLAVNLAGVSRLDSSGIGAFVRAHTTILKAGGKCRFFAAPKLVMQTLHMVRLDTVLDLAEDEASALARF
ncbi:MAG: STAS domain-containing protein [Terriglobia bacterium]|jgi:anti-sigma B factor antagonist